MKKFSFIKLWCVMLWVVLGMGQAFADGEDCLETATIWKDCVSAPEDTTIGTVVYKKITSEKELAWFSKNNTKGEINAILLKDLDMADKLWIPICAGDGGTKFKATFDGNGHVIKNLYVDGSELVKVNPKYGQNLGFVGTLGGGTIKNLVLENVNIIASNSAGDIVQTDAQGTKGQISVGAVVGWMADNDGSKVQGCMASGSIMTSGSGQGVGGIVGNAKNGEISNCMSLVEIVAHGNKAYIGGVVGLTKEKTVTVKSCVYAGPGLMNEGSNGYTGGIAGYAMSGTLSADSSYYLAGDTLSSVGAQCADCNVTDKVDRVTQINTEEIACHLNGYEENGTCKSEPWSVGQTGLLLNGYGVDGYKVTYNANEGEFADHATTKNIFLDAGLDIPMGGVDDPYREGYVFRGWAKVPDATSPSENLGTVTGAVTVYAVWEEMALITFDANGGFFPPANPFVGTKSVYVEKGTPITVENLGELPESYCKETLPETGCRVTMYFIGWSRNATATAADLDLNSLNVLASENETIFAVWSAVETHTVTFHAEGSTTVDFVAKVDDGYTVTERPDPNPSRLGYEFDAWYYGETEFDFNTKITESIILNAKWQPFSYAINYNLPDGAKNNANNPATYTIEDAVEFEDPVWTGHEFVGWFEEDTYKTPARIPLGTTGVVNVYPQWTVETYRIRYLADNTSHGGAPDQYKEYGDEGFHLLPAGHFTRGGYSQNGWSLTEGGDKYYDLDAIYTRNAPLTLYPTWELDVYTIAYECDECTHSNVTTYTVNDKVTLSNPEARERFTFGGWFDNADFEGDAVTVIAKGSTGNKTFYAKWNKVYPFVTQSGAVTITEYANGTAEAVIDGDYEGTDAVTLEEDIEVTSVVWNRDFGGVPATITLPFEIDVANVEGAKFYNFGGMATKADGKKAVQMNRVKEGKLAANTPYGVRPTGSTITFNGPVTFKKTEEASVTVGEWKFVGLFAKYVVTESDEGRLYGFAGESKDGISQGKFVRFYRESPFKALRAYMLNIDEAPPTSLAPGLFKSAPINRNIVSPLEMEVEWIDDEEGTMNLRKSLNAPMIFKSNKKFDLKGRSVGEKSKVKGVYYDKGGRK